MEAKALSELLKGSAYISESLTRAKEDISSGKTLANHPERSPSEYLEQAINARQAFRSLADGIQANRALAQLQKEKIERSKIHLEGLQYYKQILINKINQADIDVVDLKEFLEEPFECLDWEDNYSQGQAKIKLELDKKKSKKAAFQEKVKLKIKKEEEYFNKKQLYQKIMPTQAKKLHDQILETSKFFNINTIEKFEVIDHPLLSSLFDLLNPLKDSKSIQMSYSKEQFEQIQIILNKTDSKLYKQAQSRKLLIQQKGIKFTIASLKPHINKLVIGVDRRQDFSNQEIFNRLIQDQEAKAIFPQPISEFQRNINNKYVQVNWIQTILSFKSMDGNAFIDLIRQRIFSLQLSKAILQNFKKLSFYSPLLSEGQQQTVLSLKKVNVSAVQKLSFEDYLKLIHVPLWVSKYLNTYALLQQENKQKSLEEQMKNQIDRTNFDEILSILHLQDMKNRNTNTYYRIQLTIHQYFVTFLIVLPLNYPNSNSTLRLIEMSSAKGDNEITDFENVPCKFNPSANQFKLFTPSMSCIEQQVNSDIQKFIKSSGYRSFRLLLQINRLITLIGDISIKKQ